MNDIQELLKLSVEERLELIGVLWDSIEADRQPPLSDALQAELERRLAEIETNPDDLVDWDDVQVRLRQLVK